MSTPDRRLRQRIERQGPIPFVEFMKEALYGAGGYYAGETSPIGIQGDFVPGSSLSPLFGQATAELVRHLDAALGAPADVLEVGYGSGHHLRCLTAELARGPARRILAVDRVPRPLPDGIQVFEDLQEVPAGSVRGLVFSYELFDALPVHRLLGRPDGTVGELWVDLGPEGDFLYVEGELSDPDVLRCLEGNGTGLEVGQIADVTLEWHRLYDKLAQVLDQGLLVTCDYGFERRALLDRRVRFHGTLACYRRQRVHRDALQGVGQQDLTAHVDFTTLVEAGETAGLETVALTRQARWLMACGIFDRLQGADQSTRLQAMDLLSPDGMGEEIRVLVQARGVEGDALFDSAVLTGAGGDRVDRPPGRRRVPRPS